MVHQQLSPAPREGREIRIDRQERALAFGVGRRDVALEIERAPVPVGPAEDDVLELIDRRRVRIGPAQHARPSELGAGLEARKDLRARLSILHRAHHHLRRRDLRGRQARRRVGAGALQHARVEAASRRILDEAVLDAVDRVARLHDRRVDHREFADRDDARLILEHRLRHPDAPRVEVRLRVRRRAGDDAVEILRIALRLDERLAAAGRAAVPVRSRRRAAVERGDDRLRLLGHVVLGSVRVVDELLGMPERERRGGAGVSRVGGAGRVAAFHGARHRGVTDRPGPAAVADRLEFSVPSREGQPHFHFDVGIARRLQRRRDAAERRHALEAVRGGARTRRRERAGCDLLRGGDRRVRQTQRRQALARLRRGERRAAHECGDDRCANDGEFHAAASRCAGRMAKKRGGRKEPCGPGVLRLDTSPASIRHTRTAAARDFLSRISIYAAFRPRRAACSQYAQ